MSRNAYALPFVSLVAISSIVSSCGDTSVDSLNLGSSRTPSERHVESDVAAALGLTRNWQNNTATFGRWLISGEKGQVRNGGYRPENYDRFFSAVVQVKDSQSGQQCSGVRVAENGDIYLVTAAHCFISNDPLGRRKSGLGVGLTFQMNIFSPEVVSSSSDPNANSYLRLYTQESSSQQYSNRPVQQYGNGDAIKILLKERAAQSEISSSTIPICSPDSNTPPAGRKFDEVIIGQTEENVKSQGLGKKFLVSTESRSLLEKAQSTKDEDKSALLFVGQREIVMPQFLFDVLKSKSSQALTKLVTVVQDEDLNFWRNSPQQSDGFSLSARQGGVGAGDSGSPIIRVETELPSPGRETLELAPYVTKMTCLKGIVVRENLDNKLSLHSDTDGDPSGKISSSAITQEVDNPKRWAQIYPADQRTFVQTGSPQLSTIAPIRTFVGSRVLQSLEKPNQGCVSQSGSCPLRAPFLDARRLTALNDARQYVSSLNPDLRNLEFDACIAQLASFIKSGATTTVCQRLIGDKLAGVLIQFNLKP